MMRKDLSPLSDALHDRADQQEEDDDQKDAGQRVVRKIDRPGGIRTVNGDL